MRFVRGDLRPHQSDSTTALSRIGRANFGASQSGLLDQLGCALRQTKLGACINLNREGYALEQPIRRNLEAAGVGFLEDNGGGPSVRLRKPTKEKPKR